MKRKLKKLRLIAICVAVIMLFSSAPGVNAADASVSVDELIAGQARAVAANETLMQYFYDDGWIYEYPEYFGGCYIEDNVLYIRLVDPTKQTEEVLKNLLAEYEDVVEFVYGQYSQSELQEYADETAAELEELGYEVMHWYVDNITSQIVIGVLGDDVDSASMLIENQQSQAARSNLVPEVVIEEGNSTTTTSSDGIVGGAVLTMGSGTRSAGACGSYNGDYALVTCGHGSTSVGSTVKLYGTTIGTVSVVQYANGGYGDYSIVTLTSGTISHKIGSSSDGYVTITKGTNLSPAVGTYVTKYGYKTGYSYGTVTATNVSINPATGMTVYGMTKVSITTGDGSAGGDSGGPYLAGGAFCGVHHGNLKDDPLTVYFTPYKYIKNTGFTAAGAHVCSSWSDAGASYHSGYCSICTATVYESHSDYWNALSGKCTRCGRTDPITYSAA